VRSAPAVVLVVTLLAGACGDDRDVVPPPSSPPPTETATGTRPTAPAADADVEVPLGRLPPGVRAVRYALVLTIVPTRERFTGEVRITVELADARRALWLHGLDLQVTDASIEVPDATRVPARWEQVTPQGVVALTPERPVGPGRATIHVAWDATVDRNLRGVFRTDVAGKSYVFTQFEPILARRAFPSFDEPVSKAPFELTLVVPSDAVAIANSPEVAREPATDGLVRIRFAPTPPLPTYLLAFAIGPLDVVTGPDFPASAIRSRPVPFRGLAAHGNGARLAYALANAGAIFQELEAYFGIAYPFDKLDFLALPDLAWGGMENAGAITFRESILLLDGAGAGEDQRRRYADIVAHEVAHQWFGDLVTMPWWDDLWLNEAFATWMATRIVERVHPEYQAGLTLIEHVHGAMDQDGLGNARRIRQPIDTVHDIVNAFDGITYQKGAGVLAMFERWIGSDIFRRGLARYLEAHRFGSATTADLLKALSEVAERDVTTPFDSFLDQPGVPLIEAELACDAGTPRLKLRQSRALPVGSTADRKATWQVPVCARYAGTSTPRDACTLLTAATGDLPLPNGGCPEWVMPNAGGAGYYHWTLPATELARLREHGWSALAPAERLSVADSLDAAFDAATLPAAQVLAALPPLAADPSRAVAVAPMRLVQFVREQVVEPEMRPAVEAWARSLYAPRLARIGWAPSGDEAGDVRLLRARVIAFLARQGRDPVVRRTAAARGRELLGGRTGLRLDAIAPELIEVVLPVSVQEGDAAFFDKLVARLRTTDDDLTRLRLLSALGTATDVTLAGRARDLAIGPDVRVGETMRVLWSQAGQPETRAATWDWVRARFDTLVGHLPERNAGELPLLASSFCDAARADEVEAFFRPRIQGLLGGPRNLASAVEAINLCAARVEAQRASAHAFFATR
jgi:alanyl aminopeptidase